MSQLLKWGTGKGVWIGVSVLLTLDVLPGLFGLGDRVSWLRLWSQMQFGTALTLLFSAISLVLYGRYPRSFRYLAVFPLVVGTITVLGYLTGLNLGFHAVLKTLLPFLPERFFGRMSPNTALSFTTLGLTFLFMASETQRARRAYMGALVGAFTYSLGTVTLLGHLLNLEGSLAWGDHSFMSIPTSVSFMIFSCLQVLECLRIVHEEKDSNYHVASFLLKAGMFFVVVCGWRFMFTIEGRRINELTEEHIKSAQVEFVEAVEPAVLAIRRMAYRTEYEGVRNIGLLEVDSRAYMDHIDIIQQIGVLDRKGKIIWSLSRSTLKEKVDFQSPEVRELLEREAKSVGAPKLQMLPNFSSGEVSHLLSIPLKGKNTKVGHTYFCVVNLPTLFKRMEVFDRYGVEVQSGKNVFFRFNMDVAGDEGWTKSARFESPSIGLTFRFTPTLQRLRSRQSRLPLAVLCIGLFLSLLVGSLYQSTLTNREKERKLLQAEEFNQKSLKWKNDVLNAANYSIISTDTEGIILTFNRAAEKLLGYTAEEMVGKNTPAILHDPGEVGIRAKDLSVQLNTKIEPGFDAFVAKARATNLPDENEWTYIRKDGSRFPVLLSVTCLRGFAGEVTGYLGIAADLTEKKAQDEKIAVTNARLSRVIEATQEGVWEHDLKTNEVIFFGRQSRKIMGFDPNIEPTFSEIESRIELADRKTLRKNMGLDGEKGETFFEIETRLQFADEKGKRWVRFKGKILRSVSGVPEKLVATLGDVSDKVLTRIALEEALKESRAATETKLLFLANVSHEIRTPLNGIIGMTDLVMETKLTDDQRSMLSMVQQSGASLLLLINDVLDFSKIESGKMVLEESEFDIREVVENQLGILSPKTKEKKLSLVANVEPTLTDTLIGDYSRLGQVLMNLVGNAIKFTHSGFVSVRVRSTQDARAVTVEVQDSGIGISAEAKAKLFSPFIQADQSTSRKYGGTGLGLSICKRIVEAMGGQVSVDSVEGEGSTFKLNIPFRRVRNPQANQKLEERRDYFAGTRVYVGHDVAAAREVLELYLRNWGMEVSVFSSADNAFSAAKRSMGTQAPCGLLMVGAPYRCVSLLKKGEKFLGNFGEHKPPPMVLIATFGFRPHGETLNKRGFSGLIHEPLGQSAVFDAVSRALVPHLHEQVMKEELQATGKQLDGRNFRILVADDVNVNQILTRKMLESLGYSVNTVGNGLEVLHELEDFSYDLILMDCQMPEMNGYEATAQIRAMDNPKLKNIPIIALTANALSGDDKKCVEAGMDDYLSKPIRRDALERKVGEWLEEKKARKAA